MATNERLHPSFHPGRGPGVFDGTFYLRGDTMKATLLAAGNFLYQAAQSEPLWWVAMDRSFFQLVAVIAAGILLKPHVTA